MASARDVIYEFEPLWGAWKISEFIGQGTYGKVYKIVREEWGQKQVAAVKIISIPQSRNDLREAQSIGIDEKSVKGYFEDFAKNIINEIEMMYKLKGNSNIVNYEDHMICEKKDDIGWHIIIRMEYLKSLPDYIIENKLTKEKVITMGIDICKALETCELENIIHRDIKDANIFIAKNGNFKLGDFGIAKELSKTGRAASMRGTPLYMAPEVYKGQEYDLTVDIYSLGILMYKLLNKGRFPFMPPYPTQMTYNDTEKAIIDRMSGKDIPAPSEAGEMLSRIILKACSYKSEDRYRSPSEMREALEEVLINLRNKNKDNDLDKKVFAEENDNKADHSKKQEKSFNETVSIFEEVEPHQEIEQEIKDQATPIADFDKTVSIFSNENEKDANLDNINDVTVPKDDKSNIVEHKENLERISDVPERKKNKWILPVAVLLILILSVSVFYLIKSGEKEETIANTVTLEEIKINETLPQSGSIKLTLSAKYSDGTIDTIDEGIAWSSDNEEVAKIDENGNLTFVENGYGKVNITAVYMDKKATVSTEIAKPIVLTAIEIVEEGEDSNKKLLVYGQYSDGNRELISSGIKWTSDNDAVNVAEDGSITIVKKDKEQINVYAEHEGMTDSITMVIKAEKPSTKPAVKKTTTPKKEQDPIPIQ